MQAEADLRNHIMKITNAAADKGYDGEVQLVFIII